MSDCCSKSNNSVNNKRVCAAGAAYAKKQKESEPKIAILCCEGGCTKGEVARVAANKLAYLLEKNKSVRICLGDAATADSGMFEMITSAPKVIAIEGCFLSCGTEIMKKRMPDFKPEIVVASDYYKTKNEYFEIFDMPKEELDIHSEAVALEIQKKYF